MNIYSETQMYPSSWWGLHYLRQASQLDISPFHSNKRITLTEPFATPYNTEFKLLCSAVNISTAVLFCMSISSQHSGLHTASFCSNKSLALQPHHEPTSDKSSSPSHGLSPSLFPIWKCPRPLVLKSPTSNMTTSKLHEVRRLPLQSSFLICPSHQWQRKWDSVVGHESQVLMHPSLSHIPLKK